MEYSEYRDGIERAQRRGLIVTASNADLTGSRDRFNHLPNKEGLGALNYSNTRRLCSLGHSAINFLVARHPVDVLVLGHGSGTECADIDMHLRGLQQRRDSKIHSVGLTPFSPFHPVKATVNQIAEMVRECYENPDMDEGLRKKLKVPVISLRETNPFSFRIGLDTAIELQEHFGQKIIGTTQEAYCDREFIGKFPGSVPTDQKYDLIYESHGPLMKAKNPQARKETEQAIISLLKKDGIFVFKSGVGLALDDRFQSGNLILIVSERGNRSADETECFVVRADGEIGRRLLAEYGALLGTRNRMKVQNASELIQGMAFPPEKD